MSVIHTPVVDFAHHPCTQPVANVGLAFVGMSRTQDWGDQGFRGLPDFWEFRKVLKDKLFLWRARLEEDMDKLHDKTMAMVQGGDFNVEQDVAQHRAWSEDKNQQLMSDAELRDLTDMLAVRGLRKAPDYPDEPPPNASHPS